MKGSSTMDTRNAEHSVPMSGETRGHAIKQRMDAIGISTRELADRIGMDRKTIARVIEGGEGTRPTTYSALEVALDRLEEELGMDADTASPKAGVVEFRVSGNFGVDVVVNGPVENIAELRAAVADLIREMHESETPRSVQQDPPA